MSDLETPWRIRYFEAKKYRPEYCEKLVEHMREGGSLVAFSRVVNADEKSIRNWLKRYAEFHDAYELGKSLWQGWWEEVGRAGILGKVKGFNANAWCFMMRCRMGWIDKQRIEHEISKNITIDKKDYSCLSDDDLIKLAEINRKLIESKQTIEVETSNDE